MISDGVVGEGERRQHRLQPDRPAQRGLDGRPQRIKRLVAPRDEEFVDERRQWRSGRAPARGLVLAMRESASASRETSWSCRRIAASAAALGSTILRSSNRYANERLRWRDLKSPLEKARRRGRASLSAARPSSRPWVETSRRPWPRGCARLRDRRCARRRTLRRRFPRAGEARPAATRRG